MLAFYDDYGRGMDGMHLPLVARCFRTKVVERQVVGRPAAEPADPVGGHQDGAPDSTAGRTDSPMLVTTGSIPRIEVEVAKAPPPSVLDDDTAMLLIDFR